MTQLNTLVVGTSLGEESDAVVRSALALRRTSGADLILAHGFPPP